MVKKIRKNKDSMITMSLKTGFKQVALPVELVGQVGEYIQEHKEEGYMSIPEFIREAVRMHLKEKLNSTN